MSDRAVEVVVPASAAAPLRLEPVSPSERIHALDVLRGWAMFGVLWSNLNDWYNPTAPVTRLDHALAFVQDWFIEGRFYTLLLFLFGIGFAIQLARAADRQASIGLTYLRRTGALLAIGLVHGIFIWSGDILAEYALVAATLLLFQKVRPRKLLVAGIVLWAIKAYAVWWATRLLHLGPLRLRVSSFRPHRADAIFANHSLADIQHQRLLDFAGNFAHWFVNAGFVNVLALFLVGVWAYRSGFAMRVIRDPRAARRLLGWSAVIALVGYAVRLWGARVWPAPPPVLPTGPLDWHFWGPRPLVLHVLNPSEPASSVVYAALLVLAFQTARGSRLLAPLAATGRMALTTYLTQSVVCTSLFYGFGLGWFGRVSYTGMLWVTLVLFAAQMVASTWWLRYFRFGPAEWLWRTLTYGRLPAMRVARAGSRGGERA